MADFLTGRQSPQAYLDTVGDRASDYSGFNLFVGDAEHLAYCSNRDEGPVRWLAPGIYGLSNHLLDTPWPKVGAGKTALAQALDRLPDERALFDLLRDDGTHPDHALPSTGVPLAWERLLSAAFVRSPEYGTRGSTVVCVGADGWIGVDEQAWLPGAARGARVRCRFRRGGPSPGGRAQPR